MAAMRKVGSAIPGVVIIAFSAYLALKGLGANYFWDDEAGTAIFARNLLKFGTVTAWDGRNLMAYRNGMELDSDFINRYVPPFQFYLCAASFRLLGASTFSGRLPFALVGLCSLPVLLALLRREGSGRASVGFFGLILLAFSPSFLLYIRQCRYFSLVIFFPLLTYYGYKRYLVSSRPAYLVLAAVGFLGLFFSHFLIAAAFAFALLGVHAKYYLRGRNQWPFVLTAAACLGIAGAYTVSIRVIVPVFPAVVPSRWALDRVTLFVRNLREINLYGFFPWMMLLPLGGLEFSPRFDPVLKRLGREWLLFSLLFIACVSLFSPQPVFPRSDADVRYLVPLLPFFAGLLGLASAFLFERSRTLAVLVAGVLVFSNLFSLNFWYPVPPRWDLFAYFREIHSDYTTAYEAVDEFIRVHCRPDEVVVVIPPNMSAPLQFYDGGRVILGGILDAGTLLPTVRVRKLNPGFFIEEVKPDWVISFAFRRLTVDLLKYFSTRGMSFSLFDVLPVYYLGEQVRPEILLHSFEQVEGFDPEKEGVLIFKKVKSEK